MANMSLTWDEQKRVYRFFNGNAPAREIFMTAEEVNFIVQSRERERWGYDISDQIEYDEDNLDFSETTRNEFIDMCLEDIDARIEIYGVDNYEPDIEEIVFDVANDNGIWRD